MTECIRCHKNEATYRVKIIALPICKTCNMETARDLHEIQKNSLDGLLMCETCVRNIKYHGWGAE